MHISKKHRRKIAQKPLVERLERRRLLSFGVTTVGNEYQVDVGAQLVFQVDKTDGDLTSIIYNGTQLEAPFSATQRYSHYESGLGTSTVTATVKGSDIVIACASQSLPIVQYYVAAEGSNNIYMATYCSSSTAPTPGEMRFITYLSSAALPHVNGPSDVALGNETIESTDIFENSANGQTYSKYYSDSPFINNNNNGVTGSGVGAWMVIGPTGYEKSSGGPFYKDIEQQTTAQSDQLYDYMYSGHAQTENFRGAGLYGPYALVFNSGGTPAQPSFAFMDSLGLDGNVPASGRGSVAGDAIGLPSGYTGVVGLSNASEEYWGTVNGSSGYNIGSVIPGTYTESFYANELVVGTQQVTVTAGKVTNTNIHDTLTMPTNTDFTIGTWDGTDTGFENAQNLLTMHPSDSRMTAWKPVTFVVGSSPTSAFPAVEWENVINSPTTIDFNLTSAQAVASTMHINITDSQYNARPYIVVNAGKSYAWTSPTPGIPSGQPTDRTITVGSFRGTNTQFTYDIPASALVSGANTITIYIASGSSNSETWLEPAIVFDSLDMEPG